MLKRIYTIYIQCKRYIYIYMIYIRYKRFINDVMNILENFQVYWKRFGQSEWPLCVAISYSWFHLVNLGLFLGLAYLILVLLS